MLHAFWYTCALIHVQDRTTALISHWDEYILIQLLLNNHEHETGCVFLLFVYVYIHKYGIAFFLTFCTYGMLSIFIDSGF